ncbi:MAG: NADH:ubiquinone reductase (Na(+)-transporting) subunit C [Bacteroidales bacterium]|jgi:Na+-transporting NADH:ubiquinone oxidoreductase subunit C|nr:NADH:ubiquinone reductase (Na(+)-transporting) subunit C [Bacteroidales bacterium]
MERSNTYIFIYSIVLVVVVAAVLSVTSYVLKDKQENNVQREKKQNILTSIHVTATTENVDELYATYIVDSYVVDSKGTVSKTNDVTENNHTVSQNAFDVDLKEMYEKPLSARKLPVFKAQKDGEEYLIFPVRGKGLWGPIWGYVSVQQDFNTIYGATFDHQGETPGLGAEINKEKFASNFIGKQLFDENNNFTSIRVIKGGTENNIHAVDAISGGTITSVGVQNMIDTCFRNYATYLQSLTKQ